MGSDNSQPRDSIRRLVCLASICFILALGVLLYGGHLAVRALREENRIQAQQAVARKLASDINETVIHRLRGVARALACNETVIKVAEGASVPDNHEVLLALNAVRDALHTSLVYVLGREGTTIACTPYGQGETLTGKNYAFRPYFTQAISGSDVVYFALGVTTNVRGLYFSSPIRAPGGGQPVGVAVVKDDFTKIDELLGQLTTPAVLASPDGIILAANRPEWLFRAAFPLPPERRADLLKDKQFGDQPLAMLEPQLDGPEVEIAGIPHTVVQEAGVHGGWRVITLEPVGSGCPLTGPQKWIIGSALACTVLLLSITLLLVVNIARRKCAERALKLSNDTLELRVATRTQALVRANEELNCSQQRLADIISFLPDPTFAIDRDGRVTAWNQAMEQISGIRADEVMGKDDYEYAIPFYGERRPVLANFVLQPDESIAQHYPFIEKQGDAFVTEVEAPNLKGGKRILWAAAKRLHDPQGRVVGAIESVRDITERKQAEAKLLQTCRELEKASARAQCLAAQAEMASQAKSEFLANMSHEIRTPMTAILGFAELLSEGCPGQCAYGRSGLKETLGTIQRNGQHLLGLIRDILDLAKIEAGKVLAEQQACSPHQIVAEVISLMRVRAESKGLSLKVEFMGPIPQTIQSDALRLRQILVNLLGNAIKFTEIGEVRLQVGLADANECPSLQFDVIDTGIGMTAEQAVRIFQPFSQADSSTTRRFGGTGLGLVISKRLAQLLGGDVVLVNTAVDQGTCFRATVAVGSLDGVRMIEGQENQEAVALRPQSPDQPGETTWQGQLLAGVRVLLAEDGPDNQRLIRHFLGRAGADVTVAENGQQAVDLVTNAGHGRRATDPPSAFDIILMDVQMPVMDGLDAVRILRSGGYSGPIIALTAHAMAEDRRKCMEAGCDDYATKPIDRARLIEIIRSHLAGQKSTEATEETEQDELAVS